MKMRSGMSVGELLIWIVAIVVIGFVLYKYIGTETVEPSRSQERDVAETDTEDQSRKVDRSAADEARRQREEERLRKLREEAEARKRKAEEEANRRLAYRDALGKFAGVEAAVWSDRKGERPEFDEVKEEMWVVFADFEQTKAIYEVKPQAEGKVEVVVRNPTGVVTPVAEAEFDALIEKTPSATLCDGHVWLRAVPKNCSTYEVPRRRRNFIPSDAELGALYAALASLEVKFEEMKCRLSLRPQDGGKPVVLGVFSYDGTLPWEKLEEFTRKNIEERNMKSLSKVKGPKLKRFKRTVVLYDGTHIQTRMGGITLVPRVYKHLGTSRDDYKSSRTVDAFRDKWEKLYAEALRQEREAERIERKNAQAVAEFERKQEQSLRTALRISSAEIEAELSKWRIVVERGRIKNRTTAAKATK